MLRKKGYQNVENSNNNLTNEFKFKLKLKNNIVNMHKTY